jgi:hypothetical protein
VVVVVVVAVEVAGAEMGVFCSELAVVVGGCVCDDMVRLLVACSVDAFVSAKIEKKYFISFISIFVLLLIIIKLSDLSFMHFVRQI